MTDLIESLSSWRDQARADERHLLADTLTEAISELSRHREQANEMGGEAIRSAAIALTEYGWSDFTVEQSIYVDDYPDELPGAVADWLVQYAEDQYEEAP